MDTIDTLRNLVAAMPCAFAENGTRNDITSSDSSTDPATNLYNGFTTIQSLPIAYEWKDNYDYVINDFCTVSNVKYKCVEDHTSSSTKKPPTGADWEDYWVVTTEQSGRPILRGDINALGNLGTEELFYQMCGGVYTFDPAVCQAIGGYPYGAVLTWINPSDGLWRLLKCMKTGGNCFTDFRANGPDGTDWVDVTDPAGYAANPCMAPTALFTASVALAANSSTVVGPVSITGTGFAYCGEIGGIANITHANGTTASFNISAQTPIPLTFGDTVTVTITSGRDGLSGTFQLAHL